MGFSGFFSSSETSLFSLGDLDLEQMRRDKNPRIDLIERLRSEPRRLIVTILIGNEFVNVAASVLSAAFIIQVVGAENELINLFVMVPILLLFGEITPKVLAIRNNKAFATFEAYPIHLFARSITPLRWVIREVADFFITLIVGKERSRGNIVTEDMVRTLARDAVGSGALDHREAQLIDQIFEFGNKRVDEVMTPRSDIHFLSVDTPISELMAEIKHARQTRYPVYRGHRDTIVGILHTRDLLGRDLDKLAREPHGLRKLLRDANFFPETKPAVELFHTFRQRKLSFALMVDEYGGVTGLVSMEDLLECVFGDIHSPSDVSTKSFVKALGEGRFDVDPAIPLDAFNREFNLKLSEEGVETLGGVLLHEFGELPANGDEVTIDGYKFTVQEVGNTRIRRVLMQRVTLAVLAEVPSTGAESQPTEQRIAAPSPRGAAELAGSAETTPEASPGAPADAGSSSRSGDRS